MTFFGCEISVRTFLGLTKSETPEVSRFYDKQLYYDAKTVWNSLELLLLLYFFNWTFFGLHSRPLDFFWVTV